MSFIEAQVVPESDHPKNIGCAPYVLSGVSFIPLLGVPFGLIAIVWGICGIAMGKRGGVTVAILGALGIASTIILYGSLFYFGFMQRGGVFDDLRGQMAQHLLDSAVQAIEFYKVQNGDYPDSLKTLQESLPKNSGVFLFDPTLFGFGQAPRYFYYELVNRDHYYLRGVGPDGVPFTPDDIVPDVKVEPNSKVGLLLEQQQN
jgi:hypothetical protein